MKRAGLLSLLLFGAATAAMGQVHITTLVLPQAYTSIYYDITFMANVSPTGAQVTWTVTPDTIANFPAGFTLGTNGTMAGTPSVQGNFVFNVMAQSGPYSDTETFTLNVKGTSISIISSLTLPNAFVGQAYSTTLSASSVPAGVAWLPASLPAGLSLNAAGVISGYPTTPGQYTFLLTVEITNTNITTSQYFKLTVYSGQTVIQPITLPPAYSGQPYSATINAGPTGVTLGISGNLPPGIAFDLTTGMFSGSSTLLGIYPLQIQASFPNYLTTTLNVTLYVTRGPLAVPQPNLPSAVQGSPYSATIGVSGGLPPFQWNMVSTNTYGLSLSAAGTLAGTPTASGNFAFTANVSDATGQTLTVVLTMFVATPLTVATPSSLPNGFIGLPYSQTLLTGGGTPVYTWVVVNGSGSLPQGLVLSNSGVISGTPAANGTFSFTVQVTDSGGRSASKALTLSISVAPLGITTNSLPGGTLTLAYSQTLTASGGVPPYNWSLASGTLPVGLTLSPGGTISGAPASLGTNTFTVQVADSSPGTALTTQKAFSINIALTLSVTTISLPSGTSGVAYPSTLLLANGGTTPYTWSIPSGSLPPGLQLNPSSGAISGTPTAIGATVFVVAVTDAAARTATQKLSITINSAAGAPTITTTGNFPATVSTAFSLTLAATGGTQPYTWALAGGTLPAGLLLSASGVISGTPTAPGTSTITVRVTDAQQQPATAAITITVGLPQTPVVTIGSVAGNPATQQAPSLTLSSAFPTDVTGTLSVSFQSAVGGNPTEVQFITASGGSSGTANFTVPAGSTKAVFANSPVLATGTVAGTITLTVTALSAAGQSITPSPAPSGTIAIASSAPVIQSVKYSNTGGSLTVTVIGYSTTREMVSGAFTFAPTTGSTLSQSTITVQVGPAFSTWYSSSASNQYGGQFMLTVPFTVSGSAADVASVSVTLTNTKGTSAAASPQ